jgi:hypothetical protein
MLLDRPSFFRSVCYCKEMPKWCFCIVYVLFMQLFLSQILLVYDVGGLVPLCHVIAFGPLAIYCSTCYLFQKKKKKDNNKINIIRL